MVGNGRALIACRRPDYEYSTMLEQPRLNGYSLVVMGYLRLYGDLYDPEMQRCSPLDPPVVV